MTLDYMLSKGGFPRHHSRAEEFSPNKNNYYCNNCMSGSRNGFRKRSANIIVRTDKTISVECPYCHNTVTAPND